MNASTGRRVTTTPTVPTWTAASNVTVIMDMETWRGSGDNAVLVCLSSVYCNFPSPIYA
ncbi:hypothetical protein DPMN_050361 [Dreissena polymorpha]|uniref:Uncharacterized protein n=1 Tax=Dreissena polymorpha TaxID=45954 RepID=A0A9D4HMY0_DREPO|nr:hypothetical protein DPMN_050361 [Dreissena polymorpha]